MQLSELSQKGLLYHSAIQIQASGKLSSLWMCLMDSLGEKRVLFESFLYIQHCAYLIICEKSKPLMTFIHREKFKFYTLLHPL